MPNISLNLDKFSEAEVQASPSHFTYQFFLGCQEGAGKAIAGFLFRDIRWDAQNQVPQFVGNGEPLTFERLGRGADHNWHVGSTQPADART